MHSTGKLYIGTSTSVGGTGKRGDEGEEDDEIDGRGQELTANNSERVDFP